jgi:hypothetical protein
MLAFSEIDYHKAYLVASKYKIITTYLLLLTTIAWYMRRGVKNSLLSLELQVTTSEVAKFLVGV